MSLPSRKHPRLKNYDYNHGCYHITLCTKNRAPSLSKISCAETAADRAQIHLLSYGKICERYLHNIPSTYQNVHLLKYVIMPNHIHILLQLGESVVTIPTIIRSFKRMTHRELGASIWQDSYYDVVIRNETMFQCEWTYIDSNPDKWVEDPYHTLA